MRSVLIGPVYPYRGGIAHYTTMLYQALCEQDHKVLLVSFARQYPQRLFPGQSDRDPSGDPTEIEKAQYWIDSLNPLTWLTAFWRIRRYRPDVIVLQWWTTFWAPVWFLLGTLNRLFLRQPLVMICHNVLPHEVRWWDPLLARLVLRSATYFVVQSAEEEKSLRSLLPKARATITPLPVFDMLSGEHIPKAEARRQLGLRSDAQVLLFFGIVREYKGLKDIMAALPDVLAQLESLVLVVAGEFWDDKRPYLEMIEQLEIGGSVIIEDRYIPNEDVALYFSAADVLVAPYRHTTGSAVVQMARGFGLPVITTDVGGMAMLVIDGQSGFVVSPGDPEALATAIARYFREDHGASMKQAILQSAGAFSWTGLVQLLERVVQGR